MLSPTSNSAIVRLALALTIVIGGVNAHSGHGGHDHHLRRRVATSSESDAWYHEPNHEVHQLFTRAPDAQVGSPEWHAQFPTTDAPDLAALPAEWVKALNDAIAAGKIPDIPTSTSIDYNTPTYPGNLDTGSPQICSSSSQCQNLALGDIWDAPDGFYGTGFDDGPQPFTPTLLDFLAKNNDHATHFMIGQNIRDMPKEFLLTLNAGEDLAVHTWSHPYMTTQNNLQVVAQLGWTMEAIRLSSGGKVPKFWRPPYGDSDNRVRSIAFHVFGLRSIHWNHDSNDWRILSGELTLQTVSKSLDSFVILPKSPGLIVLEHETSPGSVQTFMDIYPKIKENGWKMLPVTQLANTGGSGVDAPYKDNFLGSDDSEDDNDNDDKSTTKSSQSSSSSRSATSSKTASAAPDSTTAASNSSSNNAAQTPGNSSPMSFVAPSSLFAAPAILVLVAFVL